MKIENNKVYFINYGKLSSSDYTRLIVMGDKVEEVYNKLLQDLSNGDYILIYQTYECFNGWLEQGDCIRYKDL